MQMAITAPDLLGFSSILRYLKSFGFGSFSLYFSARNCPNLSLDPPCRTLNRHGSVRLWVGAQFAASKIFSMSDLAMGRSLYRAGKTERLLFIISKTIVLEPV